MLKVTATNTSNTGIYFQFYINSCKISGMDEKNTILLFRVVKSTLERQLIFSVTMLELIMLEVS